MADFAEQTKRAVEVLNPGGRSSVVLVCEHASADIPASYGGLGLSAAARQSHVAWDPGALGVARAMSRALGAVLVAGRVSRLVYDCNRPPEAPDAMPARSEIHDIPGNQTLTEADRQARVAQVYRPFRDALAQTMASLSQPVLVTIHSFTPVYHGVARAVQIGVLHDTDRRLADALLDRAADHTAWMVERNAPYGPSDGVTHTLREHGLPNGHLNVMLEIRNDLIVTDAAQAEVGRTIARWLAAAMAAMGRQGDVRCSA
ncbi:N-formylglutamate amidohydrolase [Jannaschia pagri]|uniref:N-formylglutamate amidohydrolase n=1 Tax=Jannaschia pagri TaxID=2829797 RepID=A0ABQ4NMA6_9RHOB|nr:MULTISPECIES: N-formylglutamate amidohydrolase [unclassified Jannaschia]GIT91712.1 N-formylglutamate amidohydrolase [Jannaschia sp. AI_61]GIT95546.1 N-formylglutamate amidohydrolase [Jannaschia sp. AI_62]